jgi:hypothetical protein
MKRIMAILLLGVTSLVMSRVNADVTVTLDPSATWLGYMNVSELPENGSFYVFGSPWGTADLVATFDGPVLTLAPNTIGDPNEFWYQDPTMSGNQNPGGPGAPGNKIMEANMYVENSDTLVGETLTFEATVLSNSFTDAHTVVAFIKDFAPDYSSFNIITAPLTSGDFSITLATDPTPGRHVQYGFATTGVNVWVTDVAPFGEMEIGPLGGVQFEADFDSDGDVDGDDLDDWQTAYNTNANGDADADSDSDGRDFLIWQRQYGSGVPAPALTAVPEPTSLSLMAAFASLIAFRGARR